MEKPKIQTKNGVIVNLTDIKNRIVSRQDYENTQRELKELQLSKEIDEKEYKNIREKLTVFYRKNKYIMDKKYLQRKNKSQDELCTFAYEIEKLKQDGKSMNEIKKTIEQKHNIKISKTDLGKLYLKVLA